MTNRTQIPLTPLGDRLAVILDSKVSQSIGGIVIPDRAQEVPSWGTVVSHGPDAQHCVPGDRVYVPTHLGTSYLAGVGADAVNLVIINEAKVLAREERSYKMIREESSEIEQATAVVGLQKIVGCSACGEDHPIEFGPVSDAEKAEGYLSKGICPTTEIEVFIKEDASVAEVEEVAEGKIVGFARPLPDQVNPLDKDDDLGELDPARACKVGNPGCESCE